MNFLRGFAALFIFVILNLYASAQVSVNTAVSYGLRKITPTYTGAAMQVRRSCDNGTTDIPFNSCGGLDTVFLKAFVVAANPLSAMTVTSTTAYSLRRLRCSYAGPAIRVRSTAAASPTADIGFTPNGDLDTTALKTFIGNNNGFVTTWYDQSGNGLDASQATPGNQPRIVNGGVVDRQGKMPAIRWLGMGCTLSTVGFTAYTTAACFNGVARVSTNVTYNTILNKTTANYPAPLDLYNNQVVIGAGSSYNFFNYGQTFNASLPYAIWTYNAASGGNYNFYYNGGLTASGSITYYGDLGNPLVLGGRADGMTGLNGWISESLTFNSVPTATDKQFLEWSQSQYYSINGPALSTLPVNPASGYVTAWYDQSGNGKDVIQNTTANQPAIIQSGRIVKQGGIPAIAFNGSSTYLSASDAGLPMGNFGISGIMKANTLSMYGSVLHYGASGNGNAVFAGYGSDGNYGTNAIGLSDYGDAIGIPNSVGSSYIFTSLRSSNNYSIFTNGGNAASKTMLTNTSLYGANGLSIGNFNPSTPGGFLDGMVSELSLFPSALSVTRRILIETNYSAYTGISVTNNKYTAPGPASYKRFVNGIGRESATDSVAGTGSTAGMGISVGQTPTDFLKDNGDYLTFGMDCPVTASTSTANISGPIVQRWSNDWYLNKTDVNSNNGTIAFFFDFSDYGLAGLPGTAANYELLVRNSVVATFSIVSGTTKSVVGDRVLFAVDASNIPGNLYYTIGTQNSVASPLPIELLSFDVTCTGKTVLVTWATASQLNNDRFVIERTADGINFETLGSVKGAGTTHEQKQYSFADNNPLDGTSYYRLKQVDTEGAETTYHYEEINCGETNNNIRLYPNPANDSFMLEGASLHSDLTITNTLGERVFMQKNINTNQQVPVSDLLPGIYFITVSGLTDQASLKLVIQR